MEMLSIMSVYCLVATASLSYPGRSYPCSSYSGESFPHTVNGVFSNWCATKKYHCIETLAETKHDEIFNEIKKTSDQSIHTCQLKNKRYYRRY